MPHHSANRASAQIINLASERRPATVASAPWHRRGRENFEASCGRARLLKSTVLEGQWRPRYFPCDRFSPARRVVEPYTPALHHFPFHPAKPNRVCVYPRKKGRPLVVFEDRFPLAT